eukprot:6177105-Pleurochrysis_carterae.AAC.2
MRLIFARSERLGPGARVVVRSTDRSLPRRHAGRRPRLCRERRTHTRPSQTLRTYSLTGTATSIVASQLVASLLVSSEPTVTPCKADTLSSCTTSPCSTSMAESVTCECFGLYFSHATHTACIWGQQQIPKASLPVSTAVSQRCTYASGSVGDCVRVRTHTLLGTQLDFLLSLELCPIVRTRVVMASVRFCVYACIYASPAPAPESDAKLQRGLHIAPACFAQA